jgi:ArsR family transcriptional regulator
MKLQKLAEVFKALSHPHRLAIFMRLAQCCEKHGCSGDDCSRLCVGELGKGLHISPSTISHHLKELSRAGLISTRKSGQSVHCWVAETTLDDLSDFFLKTKKS